MYCSLEMKDNDQLKKDCQKIRLMLIMAFNQLKVLLGSIRQIDATTNENDDSKLRQQLIEWIEYMGELHKQSISLLEPGPQLISKGPRISQIMKYQGISEEQLEEAINIM